MNRPLQTLTLAAALSCTMATSWASILTQTPNQKNNDYEMFMEKIRHTTIKNPSIDKNLALFQENGSFSDIDYDDTQMTNWTPIQHIEHTLNVCRILSTHIPTKRTNTIRTKIYTRKSSKDWNTGMT